MSDEKPLKIIGIDRLDNREVVVGYSDDTTAIYGIEQLVELTPRMSFLDGELKIRHYRSPDLYPMF